MEVSYKKGPDKSYMIIRTETDLLDDYGIMMLSNNIIPGLNQLNVREFNNENIIYYDISGKTSMEHIYVRKKMKSEDIRRFIMGLQRLIESIQEYLLDLDKIIIDFEFIYMDNESKMLEFCYYPYKKEDFFTSLKNVLNKIIQLADHTDRTTVMMAYGIQKLGANESVTINELLRRVNHEERNSCFAHRDDEKEANEGVLKDDIKIESKNQKQKFGLWNKIKENLNLYKGKYVDVETIEESSRNDNYPVRKKEVSKYEQCFISEEIADGSEGETILLGNSFLQHGIILKAVELESTQTIVPNRFPCIIGKSEKSSDYVIKNNTVSRKHIRIIEESEGYYVEDLCSTNGTFLNGRKLEPHQLVKMNIGDKIRISEIEYIIC